MIHWCWFLPVSLTLDSSGKGGVRMGMFQVCFHEKNRNCFYCSKFPVKSILGLVPELTEHDLPSWSLRVCRPFITNTNLWLIYEAFHLLFLKWIFLSRWDGYLFSMFWNLHNGSSNFHFIFLTQFMVILH